MLKTLPKPSADTRSVSELVDLMVSGRIRVPVYQRALQWDAGDVLALFDSIYRGFPVGSLLLHSRPAAATTLEFGPLTLHAPEASSAFDVVDGQQRLVTLAAGLARPEPIPTTPDDPYVVYFDPTDEQFRSPPPDGEIPDTWVPLPAMLDASRLTEWVFNWSHAKDRTLRTKIFEAGARIRDYKIPLYSVSVEEGDTDVLREIFNRVNASGKPLSWQVIHDALYGARRGGPAPSTIAEVIDALAGLGLGRMDEDQVLRCLIAYEGHDVTRSYKEHERDSPRFLEGTAARALPTLRRVLGFLRTHAEIAHLRLLPWGAPLSVITRFFRLHPEPRARSLELLSRWLWRGFSAMHRVDERTLQRRGVSLIDEDEEKSVQGLLALVPRVDVLEFKIPERFDARAAASRLVLLGLVSLQPRDLDSGRPVDVAALIEKLDRDAFRQIVPDGAPRLGSPANRIITPRAGSARSALLTYIGGLCREDDSILRSHAISPRAAEALVKSDYDAFLSERERTIEAATHALIARLTAWQRPDRPSIDYLLGSAAE